MSKEIESTLKITETYEYSAKFYIVTVHKDKLELVLEAKDKQTGNDRGNHHVFTTYTDKLYNAMNKEFAKNMYIDISNPIEYGSISMEVSAPSLKILEEALTRCEKVANEWALKYSVNKMDAYE